MSNSEPQPIAPNDLSSGRFGNSESDTRDITTGEMPEEHGRMISLDALYVEEHGRMISLHCFSLDNLI
jgi:hypothetical protein